MIRTSTDPLPPHDGKPEDAALFISPRVKRFAAWSKRQNNVLSQEGFRPAEAVIRHWSGYAPTPLVSLGGIANAMGVDRVWYKNEALRFGLDSFKALGGAYAIAEFIMREAAR